MAAAERNATISRNIFHRGMVECKRCTSTIYVREPNAVADEFCVPCPRCGSRTLYSKRIMYFEEMPERRDRPRR